MCNSCAYLFSLIGLGFELIGVIALFFTNQQWLTTINQSVPFKKSYVHSEGETLSTMDKTLEGVMEILYNKNNGMTDSQKLDLVIETIKYTDIVNKKLHNKSVIWLLIIVLGSVAQIGSTIYFLCHSAS